MRFQQPPFPAPVNPGCSVRIQATGLSHRAARLLLLLGALVALPFQGLVPTALAHPDRIEDRLLLHFATGDNTMQPGGWQDQHRHWLAKPQGNPLVTNVGPAHVVVFNGMKDWYLVAPDVATARPGLPTKEATVSAWVFLNETNTMGGIVGFVQDNGSYERGWVLGYTRQGFTFSIASVAGNQGKGDLTRITARTPITPGRWYHLAGTYDGAEMKLYVNGKAEAESRAQSGDIHYPEKGRFAIGAYVDDDEVRPLDGGLFEVKVYGRAMPASELAAVVEKNKGMVDYIPPVNRDLQFVVKPYLQFATLTSIVVMAETTAPARMAVEYAEVQPLERRAESAGAALINETHLAGLKPNTRYFYRVNCTDASGNVARSEIASFQTALTPNQAWAFGIIGDTQRNPEVTRRCAEGIFALRPNFMIHCGDVVDDGFAKQQWVYDLFEPCSRLLSQIPIFPVIGNHEKNAHWYYDYFSLPKPEYYYTFTYGNAQFFMIDSNKDCGPGSEQYKWLEKELAASKATWKFTAHHHPCFSSDEDDYGDHWKGKSTREYTWGDSNVRRLVPLYEKHGVDVAFAGHIHSYERTWPLLNMAVNQKRGVRYVVSGGGGGGLEQAAPQRAWFTVHVQRGHHYCFATAHDRTIEFKAYDLEGRLFDLFSLTKPPGR